jgi:hypothetical protein
VAPWIELHKMFLEKVNMWATSFGDFHEGKFRKLITNIEPEVISSNIFSSRISISMDPGAERQAEKKVEAKENPPLIRIKSDSENFALMNSEIPKESIVLRNRYSKLINYHIPEYD